MEQGDIPSLSAAIVVNDELVWAKNYEGPAGLDTVYVPGSIQKPVTATAVLQLVERGLIDLDEDVSTYAGFPVRHPDYPDELITVRLLLTHQSGLDQDAADPRNGYTLEEFGEEILDATLPRFGDPPSDRKYFEAVLSGDAPFEGEEVWKLEPGTVSYSNLGFNFLAYIVAQVSGQPFEQYAEENIFAPLGMDHTGYSVEELKPFHASPHEVLADNTVFFQGQYIPLNSRGLELMEGNLIELPLYEFKPGAGGLRTSVLDLAEFLSAHMNQGVGSNGNRILEADTVQLMHTAAGRESGNVNTFAITGQGMGWTLCTDGVEGHVGGQPGFGGTMMLQRTENGVVGFLFMTNSNGTYTDNDARRDRFNRGYAPLEKLLFRTTQEMAEE
jgi:CubicO group peptidase (beta-lactamase class C family)